MRNISRLLISMTILACCSIPCAAACAPANQWILDRFEQAQLVAIGERHGVQQFHRFLVELIRTPGFADRVDSIVLELGSAEHQGILDRFVDGGDVPESELLRVWRDATNCLLQDGDQAYLNEIARAVRDVNRTLAPDDRIRLRAGDPDCGWDTAQDRAGIVTAMASREEHQLGVVRAAIDAGDRVLLVMGRSHLTYTRPRPESKIVGAELKPELGDRMVIVHLATSDSAEIWRGVSDTDLPCVLEASDSRLASRKRDIDAILLVARPSEFQQLETTPFPQEVRAEIERRARVMSVE